MAKDKLKLVSLLLSHQTSLARGKLKLVSSLLLHQTQVATGKLKLISRLFEQFKRLTRWQGKETGNSVKLQSLRSNFNSKSPRNHSEIMSSTERSTGVLMSNIGMVTKSIEVLIECWKYTKDTENIPKILKIPKMPKMPKIPKIPKILVYVKCYRDT